MIDDCLNCKRPIVAGDGRRCADCMRAYAQGHSDGYTATIRHLRYIPTPLAHGWVLDDDCLPKWLTYDDRSPLAPGRRAQFEVQALVRQMDNEREWRDGGYLEPDAEDV